MNELIEILNALKGEGITDDRLAEIRRTWSELGMLLDSAQSDDASPHVLPSALDSIWAKQKPANCNFSLSKTQNLLHNNMTFYLGLNVASLIILTTTYWLNYKFLPQDEETKSSQKLSLLVLAIAFVWFVLQLCQLAFGYR